MQLPVAKELPKEFALSNYDICDSWGAGKWYAALSIRYDLFCSSEFSEEYWQERQMDRKKSILNLMRNPLSHRDGGEPVEVAEPDWMPVEDESIEDFCLAALLVLKNESYRRLLSKFYAERIGSGRSVEVGSAEGGFERKSPAWRFHEKYAPNVNGGDRLAQFLVRVDLRASDDLIRFQFDRWLRQTRKDTNMRGEANLSQDKLADWHRNRLLPFLDLQAWAGINGLRITNSAYLKALFPLDDNRDERSIREVVKKKADKLMQPELFFSLQCEAYRAAQERDSAKDSA